MDLESRYGVLPPLLVAVSGTFASGKDTTGELLTKRGLLHVATGDILREEASKRSAGNERRDLSAIGIELHERYQHMGALILIAIERWQAQRDCYTGGLCASGVRVLAEAELVLGAPNGHVLYLDAPVELRYQRAVRRARSDELKNIGSLADFIASEIPEYEGHGGPHWPNLRAIRAVAGAYIYNDGTREQLEHKVREALPSAA